ncbi:hypothetical protein [Clostridium saccharoperbutylacetonicum]|uniref:hypothetical protein n=1 Tax=Clostridium saccharoperbutylacetonicum TaxID=36745 RepID=UPI0039EC2986
MNHSFNVEIAMEYGIEEAIILENLLFWLEKNQANKRHIKDGQVWTYNSQTALAELFPYMNRSKIQRVMIKLEDLGLILRSNYNAAKYDRTTWYALTPHGYSLFILSNQLCNMNNQLSKMSNRISQNEQPIPDINTDINTDIIYTYWNSKKIICHKKLTKDIISAISKTLKQYSEEEIKRAIDTYKEILDSEFYFNYKWSLNDFLNRKNGISTFMDEGSNKTNYEEWKMKGGNISDKNSRRSTSSTTKSSGGDKLKEEQGIELTEEQRRRIDELE